MNNKKSGLMITRRATASV